MQINLVFKRNPRSGNLYARKCGMGLSVYKDKLGGYSWKIRDKSGRDRFSERSFPTEEDALSDVEFCLVEMLAVEELLEEEDADDFA